MVIQTEYKLRETEKQKNKGVISCQNKTKKRYYELFINQNALLIIYLEMGLIKSQKCKISH